MRKFVVWLFIFSVVGCEYNAPKRLVDNRDVVDEIDDEPEILQCGDERSLRKIRPLYIVNGQETWDPEVIDLSPDQAMSVGALMSRNGRSWTNSCTGTLVSPTVVLTAAHCVLDFWTGRTVSPSSVKFAIGEDVSDNEHLFSVSSLRFNPDYDPGGNARHDVALLILEEDVTLTLPDIIPIEYNCESLDEESFVGQQVQNVGYGITEPSGWPPPPNNSRRYWAVEEVISLTGFDFIVDGHGESAVCNGDSGGPSLWTMPDGVIRVMGTVSWGDPSCVDQDHFARVDDNCDFFADFLGDCAGITEIGTCRGNISVFCEEDSRQEIDCEEADKVCGEDEEGLKRCIDPPDPCEGETFQGRCDEQIAIWCEEEEVKTQDCDSEALICGSNTEELNRCFYDPCNGLTWEGRCDGDDAVWCEDDQIMIRQCGDCNQSCGWSESFEGFYCQ